MRDPKRLRLRLLTAALCVCSAAAANGRFPRAQRLVQDAEQPERMAIYGTYGLLITTDAAASWQYICEGATGPFAGEAPLLDIMPGGQLVLSSETGLRSSSFPACDWLGLLEPELPNAVQDITRDPSDEAALWALLSQPLPGGFRAALGYSPDAGQHWSADVPLPPDQLSRVLTVDVAPSAPERLYVSALDAERAGVLLRSDDAGQSWAASAIPAASSDAEPYIAAVDPDDADRVYLRTDALELYQGELQANDALLFSADGGSTFTRVFSRRAKLLGFAQSPDGETLLLGYGDPVLFQYSVEPDQLGLYRLRRTDLLADPASAADKVEKIFAGSVTCLRYTAQGLFACLAQAEQGFEVGRAEDAEFSLDVKSPFTSVLDLRQVLPQTSSAESSAAACVTDQSFGWPFVCGKLGADCSYGQPPLGDGGQGGEASAPDEALPRDSSCGCRAGARPAGTASFGAVLGFLVATARRRRWRPRPLDIKDE